MKRFFLTTGMAALLALAGCDEKQSSAGGGNGGDRGGLGSGGTADPAPDTVESLYEEMEGQFGEFERALRQVRESKEPERFADQVEIVVTEMKAIASRLLDLEVPPEEVRRQLKARREGREEEMRKSFGDLELFLSGLEPRVKTSVEESLKEFMTSMHKLETEVFSRYFDVEEEAPAPEPPPEPPQ